MVSKKDGAKFLTKQRRSHRTISANQQNSKQTHAVESPYNEDTEACLAFWNVQGQPWRTEPEIDEERQKYLAERRSIKPDIEKGIYPFKDIKLSRADVEWLLTTHGNGQGPIEWNIKSPHRGEGIDLRGSDLRGVNLHRLPLSCIRAGLSRSEASSATLQQRNMALVHLQDADLSLAHLEGAYLRNARLERTNLQGTHLEGANLFGAHLEGAYLRDTHLEGASLRSAYFDSSTHLHQVILGQEKFGVVLLADVRWGDANLSLVDWGQVKALGDEDEAQRQEMWDGKRKDEYSRAWDYQAAVRTNRQLAVILREQGLNEVASRFAYRAMRLQRFVFRRQKKFGQYFFSLFLDLLAGYGYKPWRSFLAYLLVIIGFALTYHQLSTNLGWNEAIVISMTAFHGRGFFPEQFHPGDPQALVAAIEAFVGLLIEITLIATLTQRLFAK